jgi:hypothetical protein
MDRMRVLIYCTKAKPYLCQWYGEYGLVNDYTYKELVEDGSTPLNGKVVASFELNKYSFMEYFDDDFVVDGAYDYNQLFQDNVHPSKMCLTNIQLEAYGKGKNLYAWHIDNLQVFDEPVELRELYIEDNKCDTIIGMTIDFRSMYVFGKPVTKAPQSYQYVYYKGEKCLLLSVKSEHLVKILNGEKTIEIRKSVPKEVR